MKFKLILAVLMILVVSFAQGQTTKTVGGSGADYITLKAAFDAINAGTIKGNIVLQITGSTTETASAVLNASGSGLASYSSLLIYPTGTYSISTTGNWSAIDLNGADYVTIDGRANQSGTSENLTITGTSTGNGAAVLRFLNSAENNTVKYCTLQGSSASSAMGIISFAASSVGNGNDNNLIQYCNLTSSGSNRPYNAILSSGTGGRENSGNIIRNNNIYNTFQTGVSSNAININSASIGFTISGNSIYETTAFVCTANALSYNAIRISTASEHTISGNFIGGSGPLCTGRWSLTAPNATYFCGIYAYAGTGTATLIANNIIANMDYSSKEDNPWDGIFLFSGNFEVNGNTIGASTGNGSIILKSPMAVATTTISGGVITGINLLNGGSGYILVPPAVSFGTNSGGAGAAATAILTGDVVTGFAITNGGSGYTSAPPVVFDAQSNNYSTSHGMIQNSTGTVNITGNNIGSITTVGSDFYSHGFESIYVRNVATNTTISNNLIGSLTTPNSINASSPAASSLIKQDVYGLYSAGILITVFSGNTVANLTNYYSGNNSGSRTRGIATTAGSNTIQNNTVYNISTPSKQSAGGSQASATGIAQISTIAGTTQIVSGNTVYNINNINPTAKSFVSGIYYNGPLTGTNTITGNFVHSLSIVSTDNLSDIEGIELAGGTYTCSNNIVNLGSGIIGGYSINGIWDEANATLPRNIYFNSVYIGGTVTSGGSTTAAFNNQYNTSTRDFRNNILHNARSGGSGKHYAIVLSGIAGVTIDYNDYFVSGTGGMLGRIGSLEKATLAAWKLGTSQDGNSLSINPGFSNPGGTSALNYYTSAVLPGISGTGTTTDYAGLSRNTPPKMGALETNNSVWQGGTSTDFNTASNWSPAEVPPAGADIAFAASPSNDCFLDQNRIVGNVTNAQSAYKLVTNGKQLTITKSLNFSNSAQLDATSASSVVVFAGTSSQIIPSGAFLNNVVDGLTINNASGLTLNNDFSVVQPISLISGALTIGSHTLTLNGTITTTSGTLVGGSSTNIVINGNGVATLPAAVLNNLTLNRATGISLVGSMSISGTLALTTGTLTLGPNTLTLSGGAPTRSSGNIDASNASANLIISNPSAITLPASIFGTAVNNLTINGTGGITSGSDFTVNGILNLVSINASAIKGCLDMWDGSAMKTLTMGASATTIGTGDVTGIVTRTFFTVNTPYTFGNQFTTLNMAAGGTMPSTVSCKITLTSSNQSWKPDAIRRYYDFIQTGGNPATIVTVNLHYLDSELNGATEGNMDLFDYHKSSTTPHIDDHGHSNADVTDNWVGLANLSLTYVCRSSFDSKYWTIGTSTAPNFTWLGVSTDWNSSFNWTGGVVPGTGNHVIIPDASTTPSDPDLPGSTTIGYMLIQAGGILNGGTGTLLIIDGGYLEGGGATSWENLGIFNAGTSTVNFTNPLATMADPTNFYNVTIADGAKLTLGTDNVMRIAGTLSLSTTGILNAASNHNSIEFNGIDQTIVFPNGSTTGYHNLILSGSGTKTLPATALPIYGDFTISGTATATAGSAISLSGELTIGAGSTFNTGAFDHTIGGNLDNSGAFNAAPGYAINLNGNAAQSVYGSAATTFDNLIINNSNGVSLLSNINVNNALTLINGNLSAGATTLGINGAIAKTSGNISLSPQSSLSFGGTSSITIPSDLFTALPSVNNLTINRSGGVTLGNQNMTVNGLLDLISGTLSSGTNTLTIAGSSPTRINGTMDVSNAGATLAFTNTDAITLPTSIFSGNVNNLTINGIGGVTASSDFSLNGVLNLQSVNPSATKGSLDMWDGSAMKTLTMGANATTIGLGDVTGIIKRTTINPEVTYTFGSQFMTAYFPNVGTLPSQISAKISIGTVPSWKNGAIAREIEIIQTDGNNTKGLFTFHYLDSELNGNDESKLIFWDKFNNIEFGRSAYNETNKWISLSNVNVGFFSSSWDATKNITLDEYGTNTTLTWNGSVSDSWTSVENWTPNEGPSSVKNIIIPDHSTTLNSPTLPAVTEIKSLTIEAAGILNSVSSAQLTINGGGSAWNNTGGSFNPNTSKVIFTNAAATLAGATDFNDVSINNGATLSMTSGSVMGVAGSMTNNGTWYTAEGGPTTAEYNGGAQTVVVPDPATHRYSTLILSGSGVKTMPSTTLSIEGDFIVTGTAKVTANNTLTVGGNLTLSSGTAEALTVSAGKSLSVTGSTNLNSAQCLVLKSDASGTASFIDNGTINGSGTARVERYLTPYSDVYDLKFHFISSPVGNAPAIQNEFVNLGNSDVTDFYKWDEPTNYWINFRGTTYSDRNESFGDGFNFVAGKGYLVAYPAVVTKNFVGVPYTNASGLVITCTNTGNHGWNLIGNPFPSPIDWTSINKGNGMDAALYYYDNATQCYKYYSDFSGGLGGASQYIAPMQGFMVHATTSGTKTVAIANSARTHIGQDVFYKRANLVTNVLDLKVEGNNKTDYARVCFYEQATINFDGEYDAYKLFSYNASASEIFSVTADNTKMAINTLPLAILEGGSVPVSFKVGVEGNYLLSAETLNTFATGINITLEDKSTGTMQMLIDNPVYAFKATTKDAEDRFVLHFQNTTSVPELQKVRDLNVFAVDGIITIQSLGQLSGKVAIIDMMGRTIAKGRVEAGGSTQINIPGNTGVYIVRVFTSKGNSNTKILAR
jgi:hypothetical protein